MRGWANWEVLRVTGMVYDAAVSGRLLWGSDRNALPYSLTVMPAPDLIRGPASNEQQAIALAEGWTPEQVRGDGGVMASLPNKS